MLKTILCGRDEKLVEFWRREFSDYPEVETTLGNILEQNVDAIVSPANSFGFMTGGLDLVYGDFFGHDLMGRLQEIIRKKYNGELLVGQAEIIKTGHSKIPFLISAPTMRVPTRLEQGSMNTYLATRAAFLAIQQFNTEKLHIKSVAVPGMGTGIGKFPFPLAAKQMCAAYENVLLGKQTFPRTLIEASLMQRLLSFQEPATFK